MERIININLQGRVIPIEETASDRLRQYIDGLRTHFAGEEGRDEIINDIENRIAELLSYRLKQGKPCVSSADLDAVIASIGRLEDIEAAEAEGDRNTESGRGNGGGPSSYSAPPQGAAAPRGRFYRNADDKIIAGVCSGIAARVNVDPVVVRVIFLLLMGALFWVYIVLWAIVPAQSLSVVYSTPSRRLYRNADDKVIGGVCGGLAQYFNVSSWVPRLLFLLPLVIGIVSHSLYVTWWEWQWGMGPSVFTGSVSGGLFILYLVLWISIPYAISPTEKMEMRGQRIDLNTIKTASQSSMTQQSQQSGFGRLISMIFKAFFLFIAGSIALSFFGVLIGLAFSGFAAVSFTDFFADSWSQSAIVWTGTALVLGIPMLALVTWIVRRLLGARSRRHYLGYLFSVLWIAGLVSLMAMAGVFVGHFSSRSAIEEQYYLHQPSGNKLYISVANDWRNQNQVHHHWFHNWDEDGPFRMVNANTMWMNSVKVKLVRSSDSLYHVYVNKISRGEDMENARTLASHISFNLSQQDSIITLPGGFTINNRDKFRNQQVMVVVEVPVGKEIQMSREVNDYSWYNINVNGHRDFYIEHEEGPGSYRYRGDRGYRMTASGLQRTDKEVQHDDSDDEEDDD